MKEAATKSRFARHAVRVGLVLLALHSLFVVAVAFTWHNSINKYGGIAGFEANRAWSCVHFFDFAVEWLAIKSILAVGMSRSITVRDLANRAGIQSFEDLWMRVFLPLLALLGGIQWFGIGFVGAYISRSTKRWRPVSR